MEFGVKRSAGTCFTINNVIKVLSVCLDEDEDDEGDQSET